MSEAEAEKPAVVHPTPDEQPESGDESDDESEVLEESPCGRWQKRREEVWILLRSLRVNLHAID